MQNISAQKYHNENIPETLFSQIRFHFRFAIPQFVASNQI